MSKNYTAQDVMDKSEWDGWPDAADWFAPENADTPELASAILAAHKALDAIEESRSIIEALVDGE